MMLRSVIYICLLLGTVYCGPDLCENRAKLDSIAWVGSQFKNMWFFTSGGHYWYIKDEHFPPGQGKPLPDPFKIGEAAFYWNGLDACAAVTSNDTNDMAREQVVYLIEKINGDNHILMFNTKDGTWLNNAQPLLYLKDRGISQAKVEWTAPIDTAFDYQMTKVVVIQEQKYSVVDIQSRCSSSLNFGTGKQPLPITDFSNKDKIDAMAAMPNDTTGNFFYLFQTPPESDRQKFFILEIKKFTESSGRFETRKSVSNDTYTKFFRFNKTCQHLGTEVEVQTKSDTTPPQVETDDPNKDNALKPETPSNSDGEGGFPWIVVIIIVIIIVLIVIGLIACQAMKKSKGKEANAPDMASSSAQGSQMPSTTASAQGASDAGSSPDGKTTSTATSTKLGKSPSTMSVRSTGAGLSTAKPKVSSKK